jgi:hypothetical protein
MNEGGENNVTNGSQNMGGQPAFYIRSSSPLQVGTVIAILGSTLALLTFFWNFSDRIQENARIELRNERIERLNQFKDVQQDVRECCERRR